MAKGTGHVSVPFLKSLLNVSVAWYRCFLNQNEDACRSRVKDDCSVCKKSNLTLLISDTKIGRSGIKLKACLCLECLCTILQVDQTEVSMKIHHLGLFSFYLVEYKDGILLLDTFQSQM